MFTRFRSMPATAMAAVLGCALMATVPMSAAAQDKPKKEKKGKKEEAAKGTTISVSKEFGPAVQKMMAATTAKDAATLQAALTEGEPKASTNEDKYWLSFYQLQLGILNKDQMLQAKGLDAMLASGLTPPESLATYNFFSGNFAYSAKDYPKAAQRLEAAKAAGSKDPQIDLLLVDSYINAGQLDKGLAFAKTATEASHAAGQRPSDELYVRPINALLSAKRRDEALDLMTLRLRDYNDPKIWRQTLFVVLQSIPDTVAEKPLVILDTLRLMRATNAMLERPEYDEYSELATSVGLPGEVVAVLSEGKNKKVFGDSDAELNGRLTNQQSRLGDDASTIGAYAKQASTLADAKKAGATGDALTGFDRYAEAVPVYQAAIKAGGDTQLWTYRLGVAQAMAGDAASAKASFAQVTGARKRLADLWTAKLDKPAAPAPATTAPAASPAAAPSTGG